MKKNILLLIFINICFLNYSFSKDGENKYEIKILEFNKHYENLEKKIDSQLNSNDRTLQHISSQIEATSFNLTIFGIIFGLLALILGIYVTFIERKIVLLRDENKELLTKTRQAKDEVLELNNKIQSDIFGLYLKIKREETNHLIDRLIKVPKDVNNLFHQLASRELEDEDYYRVKEAYLKLKGLTNHEEYYGNYHVLFFQHFLYKVMGDKIIHQDILKNYNACINCSFDNDILKSTSDFFRFIMKDRDILKYRTEIENFSSSLASSHFCVFDQIHNLIITLLDTTENGIKYYHILSSAMEWDKKFKIRIGNCILAKFLQNEINDNRELTEIFEDLKLLTNEISAANS